MRFWIEVDAKGMLTVIDWIRDTPAFADEKRVRICKVQEAPNE